MTATARPNSQSKPREFREQLRSRALVADGALGTLFHDRGVSIDRSFDELNLSMPYLVREAHQGYVNAGADIIETNTFGANRARLENWKPSTRPACVWRGKRRRMPRS